MGGEGVSGARECVSTPGTVWSEEVKETARTTKKNREVDDILSPLALIKKIKI